MSLPGDLDMQESQHRLPGDQDHGDEHVLADDEPHFRARSNWSGRLAYAPSKACGDRDGARIRGKDGNNAAADQQISRSANGSNHAAATERRLPRARSGAHRLDVRPHGVRQRGPDRGQDHVGPEHVDELAVGRERRSGGEATWHLARLLGGGRAVSALPQGPWPRFRPSPTSRSTARRGSGARQAGRAERGHRRGARGCCENRSRRHRRDRNHQRRRTHASAQSPGATSAGFSRLLPEGAGFAQGDSGDRAERAVYAATRRRGHAPLLTRS
jgi:hypothetical protein